VARLVYSGIASLDGYVVDADGSFEWAAPDEEVHAFVNDLERSIGTYLYGRRMYDVMRAWETMPTEGEPAVIADYAAIWRSADKVVYSTIPGAPSTPRTRIEPRFDPGVVRRMKAAADRDLSIGGPTLAAHAIRAGLVDESHLFLTPVLVGGGTSYFPEGVAARLELLNEHRFGGGVVHLHHRFVA
jgi:dihydrofolate reductase